MLEIVVFVIASPWQTEVMVTLNMLPVGTPAGRGIGGKAVVEIQLADILN